MMRQRSAETLTENAATMINHDNAIFILDTQYAYFGGIRTLIPETSGQRIGNIRTPCLADKLTGILKVSHFKEGRE